MGKVNQFVSNLESMFSETTIDRLVKILRMHGITIAVAIVSTALTYFINYFINLGPINNYQRVGPVFASSFVGVLAAFFFKKYAVTAYIGAFVGMSSLITSYYIGETTNFYLNKLTANNNFHIEELEELKRYKITKEVK